MIDLSTPCVPTYSYLDRDGYGYKYRRMAHRVAYEEAYGPIPEGMTIDHVCHNADLSCKGGATCPHRACINPQHLEAVPIAENIGRIRGRKTHCPQGHPYDEANTILQEGKYKSCRTCARAAQRRHKALNRARKLLTM